jgi:hypothetical protein
VIFEEGSKLREIRDGAFECTDIRSIRIPATVERIGIRCFAENQRLREVIFGAGSRLREIGDGAFVDVPLETITILATVERIGDECFGVLFGENKNLREVTFVAGSQLREVGDSIFGERNKGPIKILGLENLPLEVKEKIEQAAKLAQKRI